MRIASAGRINGSNDLRVVKVEIFFATEYINEENQKSIGHSHARRGFDSNVFLTEIRFLVSMFTFTSVYVFACRSDMTLALYLPYERCRYLEFIFCLCIGGFDLQREQRTTIELTKSHRDDFSCSDNAVGRHFQTVFFLLKNSSLRCLVQMYAAKENYATDTGIIICFEYLLHLCGH